MAENSQRVPDWREVYPKSQRKELVQMLSKKVLKYIEDPTMVEKLAAICMEELAFRTKDNWMDYGFLAVSAKNHDRQDFHSLLDKNILQSFPEIQNECLHMKADEESKDDFSE
eukprot:Gb_20105 [translate_table: standard]